MGMYFNTEQTVKMVARLNRHFGPTAGGGLIHKKRNKKKFFKKGGPDRQALKASATMLRVSVESDDDPDGTHQANWESWLEFLKTAPSETLDGVPIPPVVLGPKTGPLNSFVDIEVANLIFQGLNDTACEEIVFVVLPGPAVAVDQPQTFGTVDAYSLIVTVRTVEIATILRRMRRLAQLRRQRRARGKKKT
jgi:hypothetical protein